MLDPATYQKDLAALPAVLRRLLEAELAAGNHIVEVGHSHPAAPVGAWFRLQRAVSTWPPGAADGIVHRARNTSLYAGEFTDAAGLFFLLEPPLPPPPEPDMDAIRAAANAPRPKPEREITPQTPYLVELDYRGELLTYRERDRKVDMACSIGSRAILATRTLSDWWYPGEKRSQKLSPPERQLVIERIVDYCRREQNLTRLEFED